MPASESALRVGTDASMRPVSGQAPAAYRAPRLPDGQAGEGARHHDEREHGASVRRGPPPHAPPGREV